mgnify:CR=1 FL=1
MRFGSQAGRPSGRLVGELPAPHLIATNATRHIDEFFVEIHTDINHCCKPPKDKGKHWPDARRLVKSLRDAGVYAQCATAACAPAPTSCATRKRTACPTCPPIRAAPVATDLAAQGAPTRRHPPLERLGNLAS